MSGRGGEDPAVTSTSNSPGHSGRESGGRVTLRLLAQGALFALLFALVGRLGILHQSLALFAGLGVIASLVAKRLDLAEAVACAATLALTLEFALDPPGASPVFALALLGACTAALFLFFFARARASRNALRLARLLAAGTVLFAGFTLAEVWARGRFPRAPHGITAGQDASGPYRPDPLLGHVQRPGYRGNFVHPEYEREAYVTNTDGFRDREWPEQKAAAEVRVLCLGDSTMVGFGVLREEAIPARLEGELAEIPGLRVLNGATAGYGPRRTRFLLERLLARTKPDLVVVGFYDGNDLEEARTQLQRSRQAGLHDLVLATEREGLELSRIEDPGRRHLATRAYWSEYSQFFRRLETRVLSRLPGLGQLDPDHAGFHLLPVTERVPGPVVEEDYGLTLRAYEEMADLCEGAGADFLVVRIPARVQVEVATFEGLVQRAGLSLEDLDRSLPGRRLLEDCEARGLPTLDLLELFERREPGPSPHYFLEGHPSRQGCAEAARAIAGRIRELGLLERP